MLIILPMLIKLLLIILTKNYKGKIKVEAINLPFIKFSTNERKELLTRSLRSKSDKLDVFTIDLIWSSRFAKWAEPLDKYITPEDTLKISFLKL